MKKNKNVIYNNQINIHLTIMSSKVCNFSCSCVRDECSFKHRINDPELRKEFKEIVDAKYDKNLYNETDPEGTRHLPCIHSFLCDKEHCGYKHRCSFSGRKVIQKEWYESHPRPVRKFLSLNDAETLRSFIERYDMNAEDGELVELFAKLIKKDK